MKPLLRYLSILMCLLVAGCAITHKYGPYYGKVVDAETGEPIEGAVVLAVFYTESPGPAGSISHFADAVEVVTDKNGEFRIPATRVYGGRFLQFWDPYASFRIFKPGYGCFPRHKYASSSHHDPYQMVSVGEVPAWSLPEDQYVIVKLPKLKTREERIESTHCSPDSDVPYPKAQKFIDLINLENKFLGLENE